MAIHRYLPLPIAQLTAQAPAPQWWRRRAKHATYILTATVTIFLLLRHTGNLLENDNTDTDPDAQHEFTYDASLDAAYLPFKPSRRPAPSEGLKHATELPLACLDSHLSRGELCYNSSSPQLDIVWTWVNGSDILLRDAWIRIENSFGEDDPYRPTKSVRRARQFRDHDELRFSMRSVLKSFKAYSGKFHLITSDFAVPITDPNATITPGFRLGQVPQWLNTGLQAWRDDKISLRTIHHADLFDPYQDTVFNSYGIESQFGHLEGVSENFIYMNDDFFFLRDVTPRSFYTSAYGIVLRMQSDLLVQPTQYAKGQLRGEWRSLAASNVLLGDRFGSRHRPYVTHEAKASSLSLLHEISQIWPSELATAATHPFRETKSGESDLSMIFLMVHFIVERWREALLWSWVVGKHGQLDDTWGELETTRAWKDLGGDENDMTARLLVHAGQRDTLESTRVAENLKKSGLHKEDQTRYVFASQDGYPYTGFLPGPNKWPNYSRNSTRLQCSIETTCFADHHGQPFTRASDVFMNVAFRRVTCGDCIIAALIEASGELGLRAFLPPASRVLPSLAGKIASSDTAEIPHLPLVSRWEDGKFSLRDVMGTSRDMSVRQWSLRLLQRYRFVIGETPSHFGMLRSPAEATAMIRKLEREPEKVLLCVNDDVDRDDEKVAKVLQKWFTSMWPEPAAWEK